MNNDQAVIIFKDELDHMKTEEIRNFVHNAFSMAKPGFYENEEIVNHTKAVYRICKELLSESGTSGGLADGMLASVLLQDIAITELSSNLYSLHPVAVRPFLEPIKSGLNPDIFKAIINMIEGHESQYSPSYLLEPKPGTPAFIIAFANKFARMPFVTIK